MCNLNVICVTLLKGLSPVEFEVLDHTYELVCLE